MIRCDTCGEPAEELHLCPCGLGDECPASAGVCGRCWLTIRHNAQDRRLERLRRRTG